MEQNVLTHLLMNNQLQLPKLLLDYYKQLDLNEEECMLLIHIHRYISDGNTFPTPDELAERMTVTTEQCARHLRHFVQKGLLSLNQSDQQDMYSEEYSLMPLWERIVQLFSQDNQTQQDNQQQMSLYTLFENEFGRPLSPIECETLGMWVDQDQHEPEIIKAALREAVISGKLNFRYIDRILFEWKKQGVKTLEQAKAFGENVRKHYKNKQTMTSHEKKPAMHLPLYNWLESSGGNGR
ncbi:DnaD domain-containing protein [Tuberibacillus sp. Marseille-P3662]|uniref:DnaD domain-containing protein n=1 Tax=Tuberibacillus sp. Marseille-P3662 TaxID=1965358 RepID=UPI000A1CB3BA|nr:DnaD domain-containing protein [Tuberibacillus sp. Marseille-P3662]